MDTNGGGCMPEEILFDILTRLPVKSLCRFRCVSKLWLSIISDPDFVAAHLVRSTSRPKLLISAIDVDMCAFFSIDYPQRDLIAQPLGATFYNSIDFADAYMISPSPSGLICFTCSEGIKIGNPITRDLDLIPHPVSHIEYERCYFGFDPVAKRHVVLKIEKHDYEPGPSCGKSRVFDLAENRWYDTCPHPYFVGAGDSSVCIDGVIYFTAWGVFSFMSVDECLRAYDVRSKRFRMIQRLPDSVDGRVLIEYKGCLALGDLHGDEIRLFILEDPENHIWSAKPFVVQWKQNLAKDGISVDGLDNHNSNGRKVKLVGATHNGELILATKLWRGSFYLFFHGMETSLLRRFQVDGFGASLGGVDVRFNLVVESLQSPKGFKEDEEEKCSLQLPFT